MGTRSLAIALLLFAPAPAAAEWQIRPFIGFTFGRTTTFVDLEQATGEQKAVIGISGGWLGEIFGFEGDFGLGPGFFQTAEKDLLLESGVRTLTGNVVIAMPRRMTEYGLRPYFVGGAGLIHVKILGRFEAVEVNRTLPAMNHRRRRHRVPDAAHRTQLGCPAHQYHAGRRRDDGQQLRQRTTVILAGDDGGRSEVLSDI